MCAQQCMFVADKRILIMAGEMYAQNGNDLFLYAATFIVYLNFINLGCVLGWPMVALPQLYSTHSSIEITKSEGAWAASTVYPGIVAGSLISWIIMDKYGVKPSIMASLVPLVTGWTVVGLASTFWGLMFGRFILGSGFGVSHSAMDVYISEVVHARIRGRFCSMSSSFLHVGLLLTFIIGSYLSVSHMALLNLVLPIIFFLMFIWMPESPYWYSKKKRYDEMKQSLICLRRTNDVQDEFASIKSYTESSSTSDGRIFSWRSMKATFARGPNRKGLCISLLVTVAQQCSGIQGINSYAQLIFEESNLAMEGRYVAMLIGFIELCCTLISCLLIDNIGRKPLVMISAIGAATCMAILGIYFQLESIGINVEHIKLLPVCLVLLFTVLYGIGLSPIVVVTMGDFLPVEHRAMGFTLGIWTYCFMGMAVTKLWQVVTYNVGVQWAFGGVALMTYINAIIIAIVMPETKGKTLAEVYEMLKGNQDDKVNHKRMVFSTGVNNIDKEQLETFILEKTAE